MMTDTRPHPRCSVCGYPLTPQAQVDIDAPLSGPGPLHSRQTFCLWGLTPDTEGKKQRCFSHEGQQCALGDDAQSCPYAVWLELDCAGSDADCQGQLVEALPEDAGTELEGVAQLLSDVWSFVDGDDDPEAYVWETIRVGRSPHQLAHTRWVRESAARFMAQARISTGNCEGPGCAQ